MSGKETLPTVQPVEQPRLLTRNRVLGTFAAGVLAFGVYDIANRGSGNESHAAATVPAPTIVQNDNEALNNCNNLTLQNTLNNPNVYNSTAFLPNTTVTNAQDSKQYILNLFSENGPLAGSENKENGSIGASKNALAAIMAAAVSPAHQGGFVKTKWDYIAEYQKKLDSYNGPNGDSIAEDDCKLAFNTLIQDVQYTNDFASDGENLSLLAAIRKDGVITDASLETQIGQVHNTVFKGILIKMQPSSKGQNGFLEVFISTNTPNVANGNLYIKGLTEEQATGVTSVQNGKTPQKTNPHNKAVQHGTVPGLSGNVVTRTASGSLQLQQRTSGGGSVKVGKGPENQSGPNTGTKVGPHSGGKAPVSPGKAPTPSGGVGGPGPGPQGPGSGPQGPEVPGPSRPVSPPTETQPTPPPTETQPTPPPTETQPTPPPPTKTGGPPITSGA